MKLYGLKLLLIALLELIINANSFPQNTKSNKNIIDTIDIIHYDLNIDLVYLSSKSIKGVANIKFITKTSNITNITLNLLKLNVDSVQINNITTNFTYDDTIIKIPVNASLVNNDTNYVTIYYHGQPIKDASGWGGFYFTNDSSYAFNLGVGFMASPHSYGRVWFPCIDDFREKATYDFKIKVKNSNIAVCNGTLIDTYCSGNNTTTYHWRIKTPIPAYLASVAIGKYSIISDTYNGINNNIPIKLYVRPSDSINAINSFTNLKNILNIFETCFGPYEWERIGYVGVPFSNGAMEHATNIAYPNACIDGTLNYEALLAHELSHHWFGNLITCETEADMWINEGWATYCESLYKEKLYGKNNYKNHVRARHKDVLQNAHIIDGSYLSLYGIPHNYTYGTTVYDKGADVVHTLRYYLGDSLFFNSITTLLNKYPYTNISTIQLRDSLSALTNINLNDFFDAWVFNPGFPHFSIDSMQISPNVNGATCKVYIRQKLKGTNTFANNNKIEITFFDNNWNIFTDYVFVSGQNDMNICNVPFIPEFAILDLEEKVSDATVDNYKIIKNTGTYTYTDTYFILEVSQIYDSAFVRVENSWVAPDPFKTPHSGIVLSNHRYWKIDGIFPNNFIAKGKFYYSKLNNLDNQLIINNTNIDSLMILYRKNTNDDWHFIPFTRSGGTVSGYLIVDSLKAGEYTLALKAYNHPLKINEENTKQGKPSFQVYPNPSKNVFNFKFNFQKNVSLKIFNTLGILIYSTILPSNTSYFTWDATNYKEGIYFALLTTDNNKIIGQNKIILIK